MAEEEGFEPPRGLTRLSVFKTDPFSQTWVLLHHDQKYIIMAKIKSQCSHNHEDQEIYKIRQCTKRLLTLQLFDKWKQPKTS